MDLSDILTGDNRIGSGGWTTAYRDPEDETKVYLQLMRRDVFKQALVQVSHPHLPDMEYVDKGVYLTTYTASVDDLPYNDENKPIRRKVSLITDAWSNAYRAHGDNPERTEMFMDLIKDIVSDSEYEAFSILYLIGQLYTKNFQFDTATFNFAVDSEGNLILRDVVADMESYRESLKPDF
jgi:hypothetical protein